jgi:ribosomal protein S24E
VGAGIVAAGLVVGACVIAYKVNTVLEREESCHRIQHQQNQVTSQIAVVQDSLDKETGKLDNLMRQRDIALRAPGANVFSPDVIRLSNQIRELVPPAHRTQIDQILDRHDIAIGPTGQGAGTPAVTSIRNSIIDMFPQSAQLTRLNNVLDHITDLRARRDPEFAVARLQALAREAPITPATVASGSTPARPAVYRPEAQAARDFIFNVLQKTPETLRVGDIPMYRGVNLARDSNFNMVNHS